MHSRLNCRESLREQAAPTETFLRLTAIRSTPAASPVIEVRFLVNLLLRIMYYTIPSLVGATL